MKLRSNIRIALLIALVMSVLICTVPADDKPQAPPNGPPDGGFDHMVQNLSEQGYDVSKIQAAIDSKDNDTARKLLDEFFAAHPEAKPKRPEMSADQLKTIIQELKEKGKDVSQIEAALTGGNTTKAQMLLDEFWKNNPDERPAPKNPGEKPPQ